MALLSKCMQCDTMVSHSASSMPLCDEHSGKNARIKAEKERWAALTTDQKLDELKERLDAVAEQARWADLLRPIG